MARALSFLINRATSSPKWLGPLNLALRRQVPFNAPHGLSVQKLGPEWVQVRLPFYRRNQNHLRSLHACALATACEFSTGFCLLLHLDPATYRLIMRSIQVDYFYQGKTDALAVCRLEQGWIEQKVLGPLKIQREILVDTAAEAFDADQNLLCRAIVSWQIKLWSEVRTKP